MIERDKFGSKHLPREISKFKNLFDIYEKTCLVIEIVIQRIWLKRRRERKIGLNDRICNKFCSKHLP